MDKLKSRKLWVTIAEMLAGIGVAIAGVANGDKWLTIAGAVCTVVSGGIYKLCESSADVAAINADTTTTTKQVTATTSAAKTVEKMAGLEGGDGVK